MSLRQIWPVRLLGKAWRIFADRLSRTSCLVSCSLWIPKARRLAVSMEKMCRAQDAKSCSSWVKNTKKHNETENLELQHLRKTFHWGIPSLAQATEIGGRRTARGSGTMRCTCQKEVSRSAALVHPSFTKQREDPSFSHREDLPIKLLFRKLSVEIIYSGIYLLKLFDDNFWFPVRGQNGTCIFLSLHAGGRKTTTFQNHMKNTVWHPNRHIENVFRSKMNYTNTHRPTGHFKYVSIALIMPWLSLTRSHSYIRFSLRLHDERKAGHKSHRVWWCQSTGSQCHCQAPSQLHLNKLIFSV